MFTRRSSTHPARRAAIQGFVTLLLGALVTTGAFGQAGETMTLHGTVRDFQNSHPDFSVIPSAGYGHYAGNIGTSLGLDGRPAFVNSGFKVVQQWRDVNDNFIAPHLYGLGPGGGPGAGGVLVVDGMIFMRDTGSIDAFDPSLGPYGPGNSGLPTTVATNGTWPSVVTMNNASQIVGDLLVGVGGDPDIACEVNGTAGITGVEGVLTAPMAMPELTEPTGMGPSIGEVVLDDPGLTVLSADMHVDSLTIENHAEIEIDGEVTILCEDFFEVRNHAVVRLRDGATLTVYTKGSIFIRNHAEVNVNTADPSRVTLFNLGSDEMDLRNGGQIYGMIVAPHAYLEVRNDCDLYGGFVGKELQVRNNGAIHVAGAGAPTNPGCLVVDDQAGTQGLASTGGVTSAATFDQWYDDFLGVNMACHHALTLERDQAGVWEYLDDDFFPVDGQCFGNQGLPHNYYFTFTLAAEFVYEACGGQFVEFQGCDDMWLFVNDQLVMDLGGVLPGTDQRIELDRMGLEDGETYRVHLFYAQRQSNCAVFRLRTNLDLQNAGGTGSVSGIFD